MKPIQAIIMLYVQQAKTTGGQVVGFDGSGDYATIVRGDSIPACHDVIDTEIKKAVAIAAKYVYSKVSVCYMRMDGHPNIEEIEV